MQKLTVKLVPGLVLSLALWSIPKAPAADAAVPSTITAEAVPGVPSDLERALQPYQNMRAAAFQGWLADRREALILTRFAETNQVHQVVAPGAARTQLTFLPDRVFSAEPRPGLGQFALQTDEGGAENYQILIHDASTNQQTRLSDGRSRNMSPVWSSHGGKLAWSSNARNGKDMDLYVADVADPRSARRIKEVSGDWSVADWSPDDRRVAAIERLSINESYVHLIDVETGRTETLTPRPKAGAATVAYERVRWSKDGGFLLWTTDHDSEFRRLARFDLSTGASTPLTAAIPWDIEEYDLTEDERTIAVVANEDGFSRLHVLDARTGAERKAPELPAGVISDLKFRRGSREVGFTLSGARSSTDVYSLDLDSGSLSRWTRSETGGLSPESFAEPVLIRYPSFDGLKVPAFVYRPAPRFKGPRPVLIDIHGGPESQFRPSFLGRLNAFINDRGIALICPNVRGSAGYGKTYLRLDNGFKREDSVKDIGALLDWIKTQPDLDASRVAVIGGSYGGFMSLSTMTHYSDRLRAGIETVGISNFVSFLENTKGYRRDLRRAEYGDERVPEMRKFLESVSPLTSAEKIRVPLLVAQGRNDPRVPASESKQIVAKVRAGGGPVWYVVGEDEGHGFAKKKNQDYLQAVEVLFLRKYLVGQE
jgi:dipeptidyl aminopeptidase/acylaminoacyl peptidase